MFRIGVLDIQVSTIGFIGIAVALLGLNTAVGVGLAALLFGALLNGTSTRTLDPEVFPPELAGNLTLMIQALILLFIGADIVIIYIWQARRKIFRRRRMPTAPAGGAHMSVDGGRADVGPRRSSAPATVGIAGIALGALAFWLTLPPVETRSPVVAVLVGLLAVAAGIWTVTRGVKRIGGARSPRACSASV